MPSATIIALGINKSLPSAATWHSANYNGNGLRKGVPFVETGYDRVRRT